MAQSVSCKFQSDAVAGAEPSKGTQQSVGSNVQMHAQQPSELTQQPCGNDQDITLIGTEHHQDLALSAPSAALPEPSQSPAAPAEPVRDRLREVFDIVDHD